MLLKLNEKELRTVFDQRAVYFKAQSLTGIPWEMLAALHFRERSLARASNPMQFDPRPDATTRRHLYSKFSTLSQIDTNMFVSTGVDNFQCAVVLAACFLKHKREMHHIKPDYSDDEVVKELFWSYNGRAYGGYDRSPYVMNGYDKQHENMVIKGTIDGVPIEPKADPRPGAYTVFKQIQAAEHERKRKMGEE